MSISGLDFNKFKNPLNQKHSECSIPKIMKGDVSVCSNDELVNKLKDMLTNIPKNVVNHSNLHSKEGVIEEAKKITKCDTELCAITHETFSEISPFIKKDDFKPEGPDPMGNGWLSDKNIDTILSHIRKSFPDRHFYNIRFQMSDLDSPNYLEKLGHHNENLYEFDFKKKYEKGFRCFGVVINTDISTGGGIHWFALFIDLADLKNITIEYFNSAGTSPLPSINKTMKKIKYELHLYFHKKEAHTQIKEITSSRRQIQKDSNSCGVYSIYYIISRVANIPYTFFFQNIVNDNMMQEFKKILFR